jgi:chromosomal replication initiator protein
MTDPQMQQLWSGLMSLLQQRISPSSLETWLNKCNPLAIEDYTLYMEVTENTTRDWVEIRYLPVLSEALKLVGGDQWKLRLVYPQEKEEVLQNLRETNAADSLITPLNPKYTFETFVVGNNNRFVHAAAQAVAQTPGQAYNPLFIYGGVGLGKTHLMHAIGHWILERNPQAKVAYVSSEHFTNELINAIRDHRTDDFRNAYRTVDILLVDDVQFLAGKEQTQEEFFHTFNTLHGANKQIVLTSDRPPKDIATLEDRLRSRFEGGLIADIQAPDLETRIAILKKKVTLDSLEIPNDVLVFIAKQFSSNIRELEGALVKVTAHCALKQTEVTLDEAKQVLADILPAQRKPVSIELIQKKTEEYFGVSVADLKAKKRTREVALPRQIAMFLCRELTDASLPKIGKEFGGRDHTTVLHAWEKINQEQTKSEALANQLRELLQLIQSA